MQLNLVATLIHLYCYDVEIKESDMGKECSMYN
jgi:hypothetical protein